MSVVSAMYRVGQFFRAIAAWVWPPDLSPAEAVLPPAAVDLLRQMPPNDQRHGLAVMAALQADGYADQDLLAAAVLHDVGKVGVLRLWHRVAVVLVRAFWPALLPRLGCDEPCSWRYAFHVQRIHPQRGAELAVAAGCTARTAELIAQHEAEPGASPADPLLIALQSADSAN